MQLRGYYYFSDGLSSTGLRSRESGEKKSGKQPIALSMNSV